MVRCRNRSRSRPESESELESVKSPQSESESESEPHYHDFQARQILIEYYWGYNIVLLQDTTRLTLSDAKKRSMTTI